MQLEDGPSREIGYWGAAEQLWNAFHTCSIAPQTPLSVRPSPTDQESGPTNVQAVRYHSNTPSASE
jgi:hypothetical protein